VAEAAEKRAPIEPDEARRVLGLTIEIERAVAGLLSGKHKSPHRGASVVFAEHREYRPGDDPRLLDWRAFARSDRHTIKRFEQETQLRGALLLDASRSMDFGSPGARTKLEHAAALLAGVALILRRQSDAVGLVRFARESETELGARSSVAHVERVLAALSLPASARAGTGVASALRGTAERAGRRGLVVLASDLLELDTDALAPIAQLVARGHEVWVLHVLTPDELTLGGEGAARYRGLEGEPDVEADPAVVRRAYLDEVKAFLDRARHGATARGAHYRLARTDEAIEAVLADLALGGRRGRWG
jgi:uncharacterized protein (DUF58 family)